MPAYRKLPDADVLRKHVENDGMTNRQIAEQYGTTPEAVRQSLLSSGITPPGHGTRVDHTRYLPWPSIRSNHMSHILARRLRAYSKHMQGKPLSVTDKRLLEEWIKYMDGENPLGVPLSVHYNRNDAEGFWLAPRREDDDGPVSPPAIKRVK